MGITLVYHRGFGNGVVFGVLLVTKLLISRFRSSSIQMQRVVMSIGDLKEQVSWILNYRPQRSWAKVMFLQASVILSTGGVSASEHPWIHPPTHSRPHHPPIHPPPREADSGIRSTSGRYASYWNAFLLVLFNLYRCLSLLIRYVRY